MKLLSLKHQTKYRPPSWTQSLIFKCRRSKISQYLSRTQMTPSDPGTQSALKCSILMHFEVNFSILTPKCVGPQSVMRSVTHYGVGPQSALDPKVRCYTASLHLRASTSKIYLVHRFGFFFKIQNTLEFIRNYSGAQRF
jgi:hypothetical protein